MHSFLPLTFLIVTISWSLYHSICDLAYGMSRSMSNTFKFYDAANKHIATGAPIRGWAWQYKFTAPNGDGLMLASFTPGSKKKSFDINVAKGVDPSLAICMMAAMQAGHDELQVDPSNGGGGGDD